MAPAVLYEVTEIGLPVMVVVALILTFVQLTSIVTNEPRVILYTIDAVMVLITVPFFALTIEVAPTTIRWRLLLGLFPQSLRVADISEMKTISLSPIQGYGIRGFGSNKLWRVSGSKAVVIELGDDSRIAFGVSNPARLTEAIQRAMDMNTTA